METYWLLAEVTAIPRTRLANSCLQNRTRRFGIEPENGSALDVRLQEMVCFAGQSEQALQTHSRCAPAYAMNRSSCVLIDSRRRHRREIW
jgi:hypothetical protein